MYEHSAYIGSQLILNLYVVIGAGSFSHHEVDLYYLCEYYNLYG